MIKDWIAKLRTLRLAGDLKKSLANLKWDRRNRVSGLAAASAIVSVLGMIVVWRLMSAENSAYIQQSIGDTASLLANHIHAELDHFSQTLTDIGEQKLKPLYHMTAPAAAASTASAKPLATPFPSAGAIGEVETDPDILDVSLWRHPEASINSVRMYIAMNSRYTLPASDLVQKIQATEAGEAPLIEPAFKGHPVIALENAIDSQGVALIALPLGHGIASDVVVAHVRLERFQMPFRRDSLVQAVLVDADGNSFAGENTAASFIFKEMRGNHLMSGQMRFIDDHGKNHFGGFHRVSIGQLAVLASIPESEASLGLHLVRRQALIVMIFMLLFSGTLGYVFAQQGAAAGKGGGSSRGTQRQVNGGDRFDNSDSDQTADRRIVTVIHGTLRNLNEILETLPPEDAGEAINDLFAIAASQIDAHGGTFERYGGSSFIGVFGGVASESRAATWSALHCAFVIRKDLIRLNGIRKTDGLKTLQLGMGIHSGAVLATRLGVRHQMGFSFAGEAIACAGTLDALTAENGAELLVSSEIWSVAESRTSGQKIGEAKLSPDTGLTEFYAITSYRDEKGLDITVQVVLPPSHGKAANAANDRWLINNGSQMVGPYSAEDIAALLYAQELDFDCECWVEGTGKSAQIKNSEIFSGSQDEGAVHWVFDGKTIHGPISLGFLRTALAHGAISEQSFICTETTINGWKSVSTVDLPGLGLPKAVA